MEQWQTSTTVVVTWREGTLVAEQYASGGSYEITPEAALVLALCASPHSSDELVVRLTELGIAADLSAFEGQLKELADLGLLTNVNDGVPTTPEKIACNAAWSAWGQEAQYFHFTTKNAPYFEHAEDERGFVAELTSGPQPAPFKRYPAAARIMLPRVSRLPSREFADVLLARRTQREYDDAAVPLAAFSTTLFLSFAPQRFIDAGGFGVLPFRTYANAGARSENEVYVNVRDVEDVPPGLYHYNGIEHSLERIGDVIDDTGLYHLAYDQAMIGQAPVALFVTAVVDRMGYKYRHPRALRTIYYDAGHIGQTFAMTATYCGLAAGLTAAIRDNDVEARLGIDGVAETVLYCFSLGLVPKAPRQSHFTLRAMPLSGPEFLG